jgi:hypothetical protein
MCGAAIVGLGGVVRKPDHLCQVSTKSGVIRILELITLLFAVWRFIHTADSKIKEMLQIHEMKLLLALDYYPIYI